MKLKRCLSILFPCVLLAGCAQIGEINQQLADWAGEQIKIRDANKQETSDTFTSKRDIDSLYIRVKREFGFQTLEEAQGGCSSQLNVQCRWQEMSIRENGYVYEKTPGVSYKMSKNIGDEPFFIDVSLEKSGKQTLVSYSTRGSKAFNDDVKARLLKVSK